MRNVSGAIAIALGISTPLHAGEVAVNYFDPVCLAKRTAACIKMYTKIQSSQTACALLGGEWNALRQPDHCSHTGLGAIVVASGCEALARSESVEGPESCVRSISSTDAILTFLRQEYLNGIKAVLEEARDNQVPK
ncbi:hypothetical protein ACERNI_13485 [Camelimonas sp. ID_303_24]